MDERPAPAYSSAAVPEDLTDVLDDARLADVLDDSPERIHSDPLPLRPSFPGERRSDADAPLTGDSIEVEDRQLSAGTPYHVHDAISNRTSMSHWDPEPGFAHIDGDIGGSGYNETRVDIITVPCPGADPVETWTRDPLPDGFFGNPLDNELTSHPTLKELAGDAILTPGIGANFSKAAHLWVRQGIRRYASTARVLLYRHRELTEDVSLDLLAKDLLHSVLLTRDSSQKSRPLFFIAHSIGGLVVKRALLMANRDDNFRAILYNCHGISFFATPHRGSSYMSSQKLSESIQRLLHLQRPLPRSIARDLRVSNKELLHMHESFTDIAGELRIWSFYETIDSQLSGSGIGPADEVSFSAPLVSIKSAIVGVRQESIYSSLESDHAHCASFGISNPQTLNNYLTDLTAAVAKAETLSRTVHTPLKLKEKVKVEIIGFYDDPDVATESDIRLYNTKYHLSEFLAKGPERCLGERLRGVPQRPGPPGRSGPGRSIIDRLLSTIYRSPERERPKSPGIIVTQASTGAPAGDEGSSVPAARRPHSLTIPTSTPSAHQRPSSRRSNGTASTMSDPTGQEHSSQEATSTAHQIRHRRQRSDTDKVGLGLTSGSQFGKHSKTSDLQDFSAGFSKPDPNQRKFMWIHLPFTNPLWVKDIFDTLSETHQQDFGRLFNNENWVSKHVQGRHSQSQPSFIKPAVNFISADSAPSPRPSHSSSQPPSTGPSPTYLYVYLPYLHFDTYRHVVQRRKVITRRLAHGRARPVPEDIAALESLELRMIWEYMGHDPALNGRRTLDQFGYPSLKDTYARDDDQMLYKLTKEEMSRPSPKIDVLENVQSVGSLVERYSFGTKLLHQVIEREKEHAEMSDSEISVEPDLRDGNLLMVDQLWLWAIDTTTLTTFFPKRESRPSEGALFQQADLRNSIYNELNGDLTGRCENALDLAAFVALHAVTVLLDRSSHPDLDVFRIFEEAIGMLTERMTSSLKKFRMQTSKEVGVGSDEELEDNSASSIKKRHKREIERAERENRENTSALLELRDMEDELKTLQRLFDTQTAMIGKMLEIYTGDSLKELTYNGQSYLNEALNRLAEYKTQTSEMLDRVAATRGDYEKLLEMAQRQAQVDDVRWSRLQTELASSQNLSVMIFTIFTVIFLPLSFFTSVFGMNTLEWGDPDSGYPSLGFIGAVGLPASALMILATLVAAFSERAQAAFRQLARGGRAAAALLGRLEPEASRRAKGRRRAGREREERAERERRRKERGYDFWAAVRRQQTLGSYEIPDLNRNVLKSATGFDSRHSGGGQIVNKFSLGDRDGAGMRRLKH